MLREVWLLYNIAFIPVPIWQIRTHQINRAAGLDRTVLNSFKAVLINALLFLSMAVFLHLDIAGRVYLALYSMLMVVLPTSWVVTRLLLKYYRRRGRNYNRVVIVGSHRTAQRLAQEMRSDPGFGYRILGFFDDECPPDFKEKFIGDIDELDQFIKSEHVDEIFYTLPGERHNDLVRTVKIADDNVVPFYYVPQISKYVNRNFSLHSLGAMPILTLRPNPLKNPANQILKRAFDIAFSSAFLIVSPIIFIPVAIGIKMSSPGPVFFRQKRTGYLGKNFDCLKFRTMRVNAAADTCQATKDDPRKTRFGDFLRKTSIDELPQFINVWLGQMSVVGPRPHMLKHTQIYTQLVDKYMVRHVVKPGITGWAQVNGYRGITDEVWKMEKRVECDVWYIEHWTFLLDLKIIVRTIINAIGGESNAF